MNNYKCLNKNTFTKKEYSIVPIRFEDRLDIMKWRNEQIFHLRQAQVLTENDQNNYFQNVVSKLYKIEQPSQLLFSYLKNGVCIGYGGLVHINWIDKNAEISFVMKTALEKLEFTSHWQTYLSLIEQVAFEELDFHKIFTYAFDLRPHLYKAIEPVGYKKEATLKEHCFFNGEFKDVLIHSKINKSSFILNKATISDAKLLYDWASDPTVRNNAFSSDPIIWEDHLKWLKVKLESNNTKIFLLKKGNIAYGQIRLDLINNYWEIDYSIDKKYRGKGLGKKIIQLITSVHNSELPLKALIKNENIASLQVFKKLGFTETKEENYSTFKKTII